MKAAEYEEQLGQLHAQIQALKMELTDTKRQLEMQKKIDDALNKNNQDGSFPPGKVCESGRAMEANLQDQPCQALQSKRSQFLR